MQNVVIVIEDPIQDLVNEVLVCQCSILKDMQTNATELRRQAAAYAALAARLEAERVAVWKCFEQNLRERERCYISAQKVLDASIKNGNTLCAEMALRVIEVVKEKNSVFSYEKEPDK